MGSEAYKLPGHICHLLLVPLPISHKDRAKDQAQCGPGSGLTPDYDCLGPDLLLTLSSAKAAWTHAQGNHPGWLCPHSLARGSRQPR